MRAVDWGAAFADRRPQDQLFTILDPRGTLARAQVQQDLVAWKRNPITPDGWRQIGGEFGWACAGVPSTLARRQVREELARWHLIRVTADGWVEVCGEEGWAFVGRPNGQGTLARLDVALSDAAPARRQQSGSARALGCSPHSSLGSAPPPSIGLRARFAAQEFVEYSSWPDAVPFVRP